MIYYILIYTWGLIMSVAGLLTSLVLILLGHKPNKYKKCWYFELGEDWGGISLGCCFVIQKDNDDFLRDHEFGHTIQNAMYGPFFIILVAIPSFIRYQYRKVRASLGNPCKTDYYDIWFEKQASQFGKCDAFCLQPMSEEELRQLVITQSLQYLNMKKGDAKHKKLIDYYNSTVKPLPRGYEVTYEDSYCATACTAWFWMASLQDLIHSECGVDEMVQASRDIWIRDRSYVPSKGDLIVFSIRRNNDHIALVEDTDGELISVINPNTNGGQTLRSLFRVGDGNIAGYIRPNYASKAQKLSGQTATLQRRYFYIGPDDTLTKCTIEISDGNGPRNYMVDTDCFDVVEQRNGYASVRVVGDVYTWTPWIKLSDIKIK